MIDVLYVLLDLISHGLKRVLMVYFIHGLLEVKDRYKNRERWVETGLVFSLLAFYMAVNYVPFMKVLFYGSEEGLVQSRSSIFPVFINLLFVMAYGLHFYGGKKRNICYLLFTACTLNELVMFTLHSLFVAIISGISALMTYLVIEENVFILENFYPIFSVIQFLWNLSFHVVFLVLLYKVISSLKRNFAAINREFSHVQTLFLFVPGIIGLCFSIMLRSILYTYNESHIGFLMDEYPETRFLIPLISGLCLISILLSAVILRKLVESSEKEAMVEIYRNRIGDMEEHMKDVERLYDGIRGMRHDMKNCIADLEILMCRERESDGDYREEIRGYLDGLCEAMDELDMKCNTGNPVTDVVVSRKIRAMKERGISFACDFLFPEKLGISAFDISILLNNGLDNALEASEREKNPFICLSSYCKGNMFFIEIRNTFTGSIQTSDTGAVLKTSKNDTSIHGFGIKNMKSCAEKYYGTLRCESGNGEFLLAVMLQGKEN